MLNLKLNACMPCCCHTLIGGFSPGESFSLYTHGHGYIYALCLKVFEPTVRTSGQDHCLIKSEFLILHISHKALLCKKCFEIVNRRSYIIDFKIQIIRVDMLPTLQKHFKAFREQLKNLKKQQSEHENNHTLTCL